MSIKVEVADLGPFVEAYEWGYLVTVSSDRPHVESQRVLWRDGALHMAGVGQTTMANITRKPRVTVVWAPLDPLDRIEGMPDGFTLIVDGNAEIFSRAKRTAIIVRPTSAVFHRPAPDGPE